MWARLALAAGIVLAGTCGPSQPGGWAHPAPSLDADITEKTLVQGFSALADRPLEPIPVPALAVEGLRGLGTIDPSLTLLSADHSLQLIADDRVVATYPAPDADDIRGWSRLAITMTLDAARISPAIDAADSEQILEAVFDSALSRLDMFSRYHGAREARRLRSERNGFGGIGITFDPDPKGIRIRTIIDYSPAADAGIKPGDLIVGIDGKPLAGVDRDAVSDMLRGSIASDVVIEISTGNGVPVERKLQRILIVPPTVTARMHDSILELKVSTFNQRTADSISAEVRSAHDKLGPLLKGVILDLRGNPGGLLDQAVQAADFFMPSDVIVQTRGRHPLSNQSYEASPGDTGETLPLVVLVDGRSASAAEILAGALEDSGQAVIIGTNTYGKGTVQTVVHMPNDGEITLTWSRFFTPSGYALHHLGILPTLCTALLDSGMAISPQEQVDHAAMVPHDLADWRKIRVDDGAQREKMRDLCPAANRSDAAQDVVLAEKLLSAPPLFQEALALSTPPATSLADGRRDHAEN